MNESAASAYVAWATIKTGRIKVMPRLAEDVLSAAWATLYFNANPFRPLHWYLDESRFFVV